MIIKHIAIIPDGNRRWQKQNKIGYGKTCNIAVQKINDIIKCSCDQNIKIVSFYSLNLDTLKTKCKEECDMIFEIFDKDIENITTTNKDCLFRFIISDTSLIPDSLMRKMQIIEDNTKNNISTIINFYVAYGFSHSLLKNIKNCDFDNLCEDKLLKLINKSTTENNIDIPPPDLIIRTSGETRLSNFLLLDAKYSEIYFEKKYWPEFEINDYLHIINIYKNKYFNNGE